MRKVDWSNISIPESGGDGIRFLRFEKDKKYIVRPFAPAVEYTKIFIKRGTPSVVVHPDDQDEAVRRLSEAAGEQAKPSPKYAMFVIDRADGRVKIMEGGPQIFKQISSWASGSGIDPGSGQGGDWQIEVVGDGKSRKYTAQYLCPKMFSDAEKQMIAKLKEEGRLKLPNYIKEVALEDVLEAAKLTDGVTEKEETVSTSSDDFGGDW